MVGAVLGEMRITMADDAEGGGGCTMGVRQHLLNENDGDMCVCGTWDQYGNYNGGWAAVDLQDPAHGCQILKVHCSSFCLYCLDHDEPDQPCDQWGRVVPPQYLHIHPQSYHRAAT